jgi:O-antigen ligase
MPADNLPPWPLWTMAALLGIAMSVLLWRIPIHYTVFATAILLGLPMAGPWESTGRWTAAAGMLLLLMRWAIDAWQGRANLDARYKWPALLAVLWTAWGITAAASSPAPMISLTAATTTMVLALGGLVAGLQLGNRPRAFVIWILLAATGLAALAVRSLLRFATCGKSAPAPYWLDANFLSAAMVLLVPLLLWIVWQPLEGSKRLRFASRGAAAALASLLLFGIVYLNSRGAWLSLGVTACILLLFLLPLVKWRLLGLLGLGLLGLGLWLALPKPAVTRGPQPTLIRLQSIADTQEFSNRERLVRWRCAWRMALEKPILGHGPGRFAPLFKNYLRDRTEIEQIAYWFGWKFGAHSDSLNALAETGFPGFLLFWGMLGSWTWVAMRHQLGAPTFSGMRRAIGAALLTWLVHGFFNDLLTNPCILVWVMMLLGMLAASPALRTHASRA